MGLNFRKSIKICKGVSLNLSKSGVGVSVGTKGARASINTSGRSSVKVGIPGTGLSYTASSGSKKKTAKKRSYSSSARKKQEELALEMTLARLRGERPTQWEMAKELGIGQSTVNARLTAAGFNEYCRGMLLIKRTLAEAISAETEGEAK